MATTLAGLYGPEGFELPDGRPARNVSATVLNSDGSVASLFTDKTKTEFASNPTATDEYGNLAFFAEPGGYGLFINGRVISVLVPIHPEDPAIGVGGGGTSDHPIVDWFNGEGVPGVVLGSGPGDMYHDNETGILYQLR